MNIFKTTFKLRLKGSWFNLSLVLPTFRLKKERIKFQMLIIIKVNFTKIEIYIYVYPIVEPVVAEDPCSPNPCGPYSQPPRTNGDRCDCSCLPGMIGSAPNCRPECVVNQDCPTDKACQSQKCIDPCPGLCGINAFCRVRNHIPVCLCNQGYTGDPFLQCRRITSNSYN